MGRLSLNVSAESRNISTKRSVFLKFCKLANNMHGMHGSVSELALFVNLF